MIIKRIGNRVQYYNKEGELVYEIIYPSLEDMTPHYPEDTKVKLERLEISYETIE